MVSSQKSEIQYMHIKLATYAVCNKCNILFHIFFAIFPRRQLPGCPEKYVKKPTVSKLTNKQSHKLFLGNLLKRSFPPYFLVWHKKKALKLKYFTEKPNFPSVSFVLRRVSTGSRERSYVPAPSPSMNQMNKKPRFCELDHQSSICVDPIDGADSFVRELPLLTLISWA